MIPRVKPSYTLAELRAALFPARDAVTRFELALAGYFGMKHAIAFPYGRSAIFAAFRALAIRGEIVQPAYNCVVVAHATVLSGNQPIFVDCQPGDPNPDSHAMVLAVNENTAAIIPTSIFGVSFDAPALVREIRRKNPNAFVLMDCAQCFEARWDDGQLAAHGDAAILAFGVGKAMTALFGGAILTNRDDVAQRIIEYRDRAFTHPTFAYAFLRFCYFLASWMATTSAGARLFDAVERGALQTSALDSLRAREAIRLPSDYQTQFLNLQAAIGAAQVARLAQFNARRREISAQYARALRDTRGVQLPRWSDGSTHTIYTLRLDQPQRRTYILAAMRRRGVQGGTVLDYVVPDMDCYRELGEWGEFPNARDWAHRALNLPNHPTMSDEDVARCAKALRGALHEAEA